MSYVEVTREDFEAQMTEMGFDRIDVSGTGELVYERKIPNTKFGVRILSSISKHTGVSRDVGADAIRVTLWDYNKDKPIKIEKRVHRTGTVEGVLQRTRDRAREIWGECSKNKCSCGDGVMVKRKGSRGEFLGCSNYPDCKNTAPIS